MFKCIRTDLISLYYHQVIPSLHCFKCTFLYPNVDKYLTITIYVPISPPLNKSLPPPLMCYRHIYFISDSLINVKMGIGSFWPRGNVNFIVAENFIGMKLLTSSFTYT